MKIKLTKRHGLPFVLLLLTLVAKAQTKDIVFSPQWHANAQFAGYIAARELGYYAQEGLHVDIRYPQEAKSSLELLRDGKAQLVTTTLPNAIKAKANDGMDLKNVLQTAQHSALCLVLKEPMEKITIDSLYSLRVGLWNTHMSIPAEIADKLHELHWKVIYFSNGYKLLTYDVLDALVAMEFNELQHLKYSGYDLSEHSVVYLSKLGYDLAEDGIYCLGDYYREHTQEVKAFVRATKKGWEWCRNHIKEATDLVVQEMRQNHISYSTIIQRAGLKVVLEKQELTPGKVPFTLQREQYDEAGQMLKDAQMIQELPDFNTFVGR